MWYAFVFIVLFMNGHCGMHLSSSCYFIYEWTLRCLLDIVRINWHSTRLSSSCYLWIDIAVCVCLHRVIYELTLRYSFVFIVLFMNGHCGMICIHRVILFMNGHCVVFWTLCDTHKWRQMRDMRVDTTHTASICLHRVILLMNGHCGVFWTFGLPTHIVYVCFHRVILLMNGHCGVFWTLCVSTHIVHVCFHRVILLMNRHCGLFWTLCVINSHSTRSSSSCYLWMDIALSSGHCAYQLT